MKNPYLSYEMRRWKKSSKIRYAIHLIFGLPYYILWRTSLLVPENIGRFFRKYSSAVTFPIERVSKFIKLWFVSRPWIEILISMPFLISVIAILSALFIALNQNPEDITRVYGNGVNDALIQKDYNRANLLFKKLLSRPETKDDKKIMYRAMISARKGGNILFSDFLQKRLVEEDNYAPARIWLASYYLENYPGEFAVDKALLNIKEALKVTLPSKKDGVRMMLARLYIQKGRIIDALSTLKQIKDRTPQIEWLIMDNNYKSGAHDEARSEAEDMITRLDIADPEQKTYIRERSSALLLLASLTDDNKEKIRKIDDALLLLEKHNADSAVHEQLNDLLAFIYQQKSLILMQSKKADSIRESFEYFDKCIDALTLLPVSGKTLLKLSNLKENSGVTRAQILESLVEGKGVITAHLLLGLDAWNKSKYEQAKFHFHLAAAQDKKALYILRMLAISYAYDKVPQVPNNFILKKEQPWKRSIALLQMLPEISKSEKYPAMLAECQIFSLKQMWFETPLRLKPYLEEMPEKYKRQAYEMILLSYRNLGQKKEYMRYFELFKKMH